MKRFVAILLALMFVFPFAALSAFAGEEVQEGTDYYGTMRAHFDTIKADGVTVGEDGFAFNYLLDHSGILEIKADELTLRGWVVSDVEIEEIGYTIDDGDPVFNSEFKIEPEQGVYDHGKTTYGTDFAIRFAVTIDVSQMKGYKHITLVVKNEDGIYKMYSDFNMNIELDFLQEGTEEAGATPAPEEPAEKSPLYVRFDNDDKVDNFFLYASNNNRVTNYEYDEDKNCCVIYSSAGPDPNIFFPFGALALDGSLGVFEDEISAAEYKAIVIIGRFDYASVLSDPDKKVGGTFYYQTDVNTGYDEMKNLQYYYEKTDDLQYVLLDFTKLRQWKGIVNDCRFDFFMTTDEDTEYELYYVGFFTDVASANSFISSYKESGDAVFPTPEPTPTPKPTDVPTDTPDVTEAPNTPETSEAPAEDPTQKPSDGDKGCGGFVAALPAGFMVAIAVPVLAKKKER